MGSRAERVRRIRPGVTAHGSRGLAKLQIADARRAGYAALKERMPGRPGWWLVRVLERGR